MADYVQKILDAIKLARSKYSGLPDMELFLVELKLLRQVHTFDQSEFETSSAFTPRFRATTTYWRSFVACNWRKCVRQSVPLNGIKKKS